MQMKTVRSRGGKFFNWMAAVMLSLTLSSLVSPAPSFADTIDFSTSGALDWSSLTMTGIDFTLSNFHQVTRAQVFSIGGSSASKTTESNDWGTSGIAVALPSVGSASAIASATELSSSLSLTSNNTFGHGDAIREVDITALNAGLLTVSIPYLLEDHGQISGNTFVHNQALIQFNTCEGSCAPQSVADSAGLGHVSADNSLHTFSEKVSGILSITIPFRQGQTGFLNFNSRMDAKSVSVPGPDTFWPLAIGLVLLIFLNGWRARRIEKGMDTSQDGVV